MFEPGGWIRPEVIGALPWQVAIPGMLLVVMFFVSAFVNLIRFRLFRAISRFILGVVILVILSQAGEAIVRLLDIGDQRQTFGMLPQFEA